jgi:hypothetical protein
MSFFRFILIFVTDSHVLNFVLFCKSCHRGHSLHRFLFTVNSLFFLYTFEYCKVWLLMRCSMENFVILWMIFSSRIQSNIFQYYGTSNYFAGIYQVVYWYNIFKKAYLLWKLKYNDKYLQVVKPCNTSVQC